MAAGQADAYFHVGIHCWDIAAGALIVREAGGAVVDPTDGGEFDFMSRRVLAAATPKLAEEIVAQKLKYLSFESEYPQEKCPL